MREVRVVLVDIECDQIPDGCNGVERVQVQPRVLKHSPPGLDQGVRECDFRLCKNALQQSGLDDLVDRRVKVLDTTVDQGETVTFDGWNSADNVGIGSYTWTFEDGGELVTLEGANPSYTFLEVGEYTITVRTAEYVAMVTKPRFGLCAAKTVS